MGTIAFAAPIVPGKEDAWAEFAGQLSGARKAEFDDFLEEARKLHGLVRLVEVLGRQLHAPSSTAVRQRVNSGSRAPRRVKAAVAIAC